MDNGNHSVTGTVDVMPRPVDRLFPGRREALRDGRCRRCGEAVDVGEFMDAVSRAEYNLSALCALCQSAVFVEDPR